MAEDRMETREINWRQWMPWTEIFRGFRVALGFNKLLLAAAGIVMMSLGWYILASLFYFDKPDLNNSRYNASNWATYPEEDRERLAWEAFQRDWRTWNLILRAAGPEYEPVKGEDSAKAKPRRFRTEIADLASSRAQYKDIEQELRNIKLEIRFNKGNEAMIAQQARDGKRLRVAIDETTGEASPEEIKKATAFEPEVTEKALQLYRAETGDPTQVKVSGVLATLPWFEDRGPNPYLMLTGQARSRTVEGSVRRLPWDEGHFVEWLSTQVTVLLEPLVKVLMPVIFFFSPAANLYARLYFLLVLLFTLANWSFFGGAITRIAAVEVARNEKINLFEALRFTCNRWAHYLAAPTLPLVLVGVLLLGMWLFGLVHMIPGVGDLLDGVLWFIPLLIGLIMAGVLVGLISWPMMSATISAEDEEALNAVSRSYSYVIQSPWHYLWYSAIALAYGAVVIFFVGFMGSLTVYLAKWGVGQPTNMVGFTSRDPSYLFVYAPTSFGWRDLLLEGATTTDGGRVVENGKINREEYNKYIGKSESAGTPQFAWYNWLGATLVSFWLGLFFLLVLGFGYSYFWSASTIIYLLMRKQVDDAELDEVYLEEEDQEEFGATPTATARPTPPPPAPTPAPAAANITMVEAPVLRQTAPPPPAPVPTPVAPPQKPEETTSVGSYTSPPMPMADDTPSSRDGGGSNNSSEDEPTT